MKIVHLSDLHITSGMDKTRLKKYLFDIANENPDGIVITGDIVDEPNEKNFALASKFINYLDKRFNLMCVPGNSDYEKYIFREKDWKKEEKIVLNKLEPINPAIIPANKEKFILRGTVNLDDVYYGCCELLKNNAHTEINLNLYSSFLGQYKSDLSLDRINILGFDSFNAIKPLLIAKSDLENIFLTELHDGEFDPAYLASKLEETKEGSLNIAAFHHPVLDIPGANKIHGSFAYASEVIELFSKKNIRLTLSGHKHIPGYNRLEYKHQGQKKEFFSIAANTLFSNDIKQPYKYNSYNLLEFLDNELRIYFNEPETKRKEQILKLNQIFG